MTFAEAYKKTGRVLCITLSAIEKKSPPVLINYISAPNVVIASAILASAAVPGFVQPIRLQIKDADGRISFQGANKDQLYWDGSIEQVSAVLKCKLPRNATKSILWFYI
jgi:predicted acylesterase/phospholipase RssA